MEKETYEIEAICDNCGHTRPEELSKGTPINLAKGIKCPVCGCDMAFRRKPEPRIKYEFSKK